MIRILHISDLHLPVKLPILSLRKKMFIGYLNYFYRRRKKYPQVLWESLVRKIGSINFDSLILSGDITNISHTLEFENSLESLKPILSQKLFICPGNHDRYTNFAIEPKNLFEENFSQYIGKSLSNEIYLKIKKCKSHHLISWDSNAPRKLFEAFGYVDPVIVMKTIEILKKKKIKDYSIVCHHPIWNPEDVKESYSHMLRNREEIQEILVHYPPRIYFHGHTHTNWVKFPSKKIPYYIINSASSSQLSSKHGKNGFHEISLTSNDVKITRYVYSESKKEFINQELIKYN